MEGGLILRNTFHFLVGDLSDFCWYELAHGYEFIFLIPTLADSNLVGIHWTGSPGYQAGDSWQHKITTQN